MSSNLRTADPIYTSPNFHGTLYHIAHHELHIRRWEELADTIQRLHDVALPQHASRLAECYAGIDHHDRLLETYQAILVLETSDSVA
jgi:DNA-binding GntR family transcriptional regulator